MSIFEYYKHLYFIFNYHSKLQPTEQTIANPLCQPFYTRLSKYFL